MNLYELIGRIFLCASATAVTCILLYLAIEYAARAWRAKYQWAYMMRAVREYGERHPEEKAKALGEKE
ncbi:hypothetical protein [Robbsia andropogonis]|uniref:hypothetical protein n=1 Tax=Robbsia andropogonis TaxID=28092 RepID=UPI0020A01E44|nr:hypothetical protein [Robbsia andropogonis]MCP1117004.1 hypothetical protein [Robbsia andropogonis]MCP1126317.1 hypothetical protein [Robbsia andropogonis]